ncbi:MAG: SDR family NAD(P)-dependent oxidoreductase, partial [Candidatus Scalindua sp.]|nr:SDR family NAD(P)-dependent oxidoreductase [Candidatus Scalindua sp.]
MEFNLEKKRVLVTGSSRGIGFAIAKDFLSEGARVVIASRNQNELEQARTELGNEFSADMVLAYPCDFRITEQIRTLTSYILQSWGGLDILLANVGSGKSVTDTIPEKEHFDAVFSQNFDVAVNAARELMPLLKDSKGNMLFI